MNAKNASILTSVVLVGVGLYYVNGTMPDSPSNPANRVCARVLVQLDCADFKLLARSPEDIACDDGEVVIWTEVVGHKSWDEPLVLTDWLPDNVARAVEKRIIVHESTAKVINCANAKRPNKVLTPLRWVEVDSADVCIAGLVSRDVSEAGDGTGTWRTWTTPHVCCGDRCRCDDAPCVAVAPHEMAGSGEWRQRVIEQRPDLSWETNEL